MEKGHTIQIGEHGYVRYVDHLGDDRLIVGSARISYKSPSKGEEADRKLIHYLLKNKHTSPFEMGKIVFNVKCPIFVMRQWVRHRMQNLNEISARYTELPDQFYLPTEFRAQDTVNKQGSVAAELDHEHLRGVMNTAYRFAYNTYEKLLREGVAKEMARFVLPVGIYTEVFSCWDMNNLLKFFVLRDDAHAQAEIQDFARAMKTIARALFPWTMDAYDALRPRLVEEAQRIDGTLPNPTEDKAVADGTGSVIA